MRREDAEAIVAAIVAMRGSATDVQALSAAALYPSWREGAEYAAGERVRSGGALYRVLQGHRSQAGWEPEAAPSLFAKVLVPDAGATPEWEQPGSENGYAAGDRVSHGGAVWTSLVDGNVWEPTDAVPSLWARDEGR